MTPTRLRECLAALDWTQRGLARLLVRDEGSVRQWARGAVQIPEDVARWLETRARHAERHPPPTDGRIAALAERIARGAHAGQTDLAGAPYVGHLERVVAHLLRLFPDATEEQVAAAWLHDVLEDTDWTPERLRSAGVPGQVVGVVEELTRPKGTPYLPWVQALAREGSLSAVRVKLADNADNCDPARVAALPDGQARMEARYLPARRMLEERIG